MESYELTCEGCLKFPTEESENFDEDCMSCRRFYPDLHSSVWDDEE